MVARMWTTVVIERNDYSTNSAHFAPLRRLQSQHTAGVFQMVSASAASNTQGASAL